MGRRLASGRNRSTSYHATITEKDGNLNQTQIVFMGSESESSITLDVESPWPPSFAVTLPLRHHPFSDPPPLSRELVSFRQRRRHSVRLPVFRRSQQQVSALISEESAIGSGVPGLDFFKLTYLEGNSWLWEVDECKILVDPVLVGNLDFGIPFLYDAAKKFLKNLELSDLPEIDCLLITQSLDDHCHLNTLKPLSQKSPNLPVIATPNAKPLLDPLFTSVTYLEPGQSSVIEAGNGSKVRIKATAGPVLGPPWQRPENGYLVVSPQDKLTLYYEPHCVYDKKSLENERADIVITPVIKQLLPNFTLVSGQEDAVKLAKLLRVRFVVAMKNGELDSKGFLAAIIQAEGTVESFKELMLKEAPEAMVIEPVPGLPLQLPLKNFAPSGMAPDKPQFRMDKKLIDQFIKQEGINPF